MLYLIKPASNTTKCITIQNAEMVISTVKMTFDQLFEIKDSTIRFSNDLELKCKPFPIEEYTRIEVDGKCVGYKANIITLSQREDDISEIWEVVPAEKEYKKSVYVKSQILPYLPMIYLYFNPLQCDEIEFCEPNDIAYKIQTFIDKVFICEDHKFANKQMQAIRNLFIAYMEKYQYSIEEHHKYNINIMRIFDSLFDDNIKTFDEHLIPTEDKNNFSINIANGVVVFALYRSTASNQVHQCTLGSNKLRSFVDQIKMVKMHYHFI